MVVARRVWTRMYSDPMLSTLPTDGSNASIALSPVCLCVCVSVCLCVCGGERERRGEREINREKERERERRVWLHVCVCERNKSARTTAAMGQAT